MTVFALGSVLGFAVSLVAFVMVAGERRAPRAHDPEQAIADLTLRLRQPWKARAVNVARMLTDVR